ncbi:MAG: glycoside hydrolase family 97 catalytic domain-containing protein, partial [Bacteroidetes bacterium]|nr:glycoside hydrolase family 97 catalytic domain-containing protein [Bacteroidota bacterium]
MKYLPFIFFCFFLCSTIAAQKLKSFDVTSLDGNIKLHVEIADKIQWSVQQKGQQIIIPSTLSLQLQNEVLGDHAKIISSKTEKISNIINPINYIKSIIHDDYNQLTINFKNDFGIIFRLYNDAVAYRFTTRKKEKIIIKNEEANFNFADDDKAFIPIQSDYRDKQNFNSSFEALYHEIHLSELPKDSLAFLPVLVDAGQNKKAVILEADLEDYPGMYLGLNQTEKGFNGVYAPYPTKAHLHGINYIPTERADYIATTNGTRNFPWRVVVISDQDKDLLNCDIVQKLASVPRLTDFSWVKPGLVSWDWWNNWNISHVDFHAGINTNTYKYYIDFAAANKIPYIVMDEGWSNDWDLMKVNPEINLQEIIDHGKQKNVGVILWATWYAVSHQMDTIFPHYASMGIKGFKIDFFDRDDQVVVASTYEIAKHAADNKLMVDFHGIYKPTGLQRTYPNVIGYEGVKGLENFKWAVEDQPRYTTSIPFIRMLAGPMDYTPGAMRNANKSSYRPVDENPMSQGTRCQQLAEYIVFYAPLQMLADNPTTYMQEQECTDFITKIPTTFD